MSNKKYVIAADLGTQTIRVHLFDEKLKLVEKTESKQYVDTLNPTWATQKASFWWESVVTNIKKVLKLANITGDDVTAFGCCGHMHGAVPVKFDGTVIDDNIQIYSDKRGGDIAEKMKEELTDKVYDLTGNIPIPTWQGIKIRWIKENLNEVYNEADKFLTPKDFINFKMTGKSCTDLTEASGTYLMNRHNNQWSEVLINEIGIDINKLPEIKMSYEVIGKVSHKAAGETGLSQNTSVVTGCGDMLSMLYISGMHKEGTAVDVSGTGGTISGHTKKPIMDKRIMNLHNVSDGWVPYGNVDSAGGAFRWLRDTLCKKKSEYAKGIGKDDYAYLCEQAKKIPAGAEGLYFLPYLMGERTMGSSDSRGGFVGISLEKRTGHFVRALLEGVAFEFKRTLDVFEEKGLKIERVIHTGGSSKGDLWNQIKADIYQKPVYTLDEDEGSVRGVALLAAYAVSHVEDLIECAEKSIVIKKIYEPNLENKAIYDDMYLVFNKLHDTLQDTFKTMAITQEKYK